MVNFRKLAKFALTGSLAFGLIAAAGAMKAQAAKPTVNYNYQNQTMTVTPANGEDATSDYFYVAVDVGGKIKSTDRIAYTVNSKKSVVTTLDLSGIVYNKDTKLKIYADIDAGNNGAVPTDTTKIQEITIKAQPTKIKATFTPNAASGSQIKVTAASDLANGELDSNTGKIKTAAAWEYRTTYSNEWKNGVYLTSETIEQFSTYGTTLIIRQRAIDTDTKNETIGLDDTSATQELLASKEAKLKIPKKANGPKAAVDPVKITVTIPAKSEWRIIGSKLTAGAVGNKDTYWTATAEDKDGWIKNDSKKVYTVKELNSKIADGAKIAGNSKTVDANILAGVTIELKTAATDKKAASKISYIQLPAQTAAPEETTDFTVELVFDKKKTKVTGVKITNKNSTQSLQVIGGVTLEEDGSISSAFDTATAKFKTIKPGKTLTIAAKDAPTAKGLVLRFMGTKATKEKAMVLSSAMSAYEVIYPTAATNDVGATLKAKTGTAGKSLLNVTTKSGYKFEYVISSTEVKSVPLEEKITGGTPVNAGNDVEISSPSVGQYLVVYAYEDGDDEKVITGFKCIEVIDDMVGKATS